MFGDFFTGSSMLGGDADTTAPPWTATITGKTRFALNELSVSLRIIETITGKTTITVHLTTPPPGPVLGATITGHTDLSSSSMSFASIIHLSGMIVGNTQFLSPDFAAAMVFLFGGEVGAVKTVSLTTHGRVLVGTGVKPTREVVKNPRHLFT